MTRKEEIRELSDAKAVGRARVIGAAAWYECLHGVLTEDEEKEVLAVWLALPGSTSWMGAFFTWFNKEDVPCES